MQLSLTHATEHHPRYIYNNVYSYSHTVEPLITDNSELRTNVRIVDIGLSPKPHKTTCVCIYTNKPISEIRRPIIYVLSTLCSPKGVCNRQVRFLDINASNIQHISL